MVNRKDVAIIILIAAIIAISITADYLYISIQTSKAFQEGFAYCQYNTASAIVKDLQEKGYTTLTIGNQTIPLVVYRSENG